MAENANGDTTKNNVSPTEKYTGNYSPEEVDLLDKKDKKLFLDTDINAAQDHNINIDTPDTQDNFKPIIKKKRNYLRGAYNTTITHFDISEKAKRPLFILFSICILLFLILIVLIVLWPRIPFYMKADVCLEQECLESSAQILSWANTTAQIDVCSNPYEWACGNFEEEYMEHDFYNTNRGEWNFDAHLDYQETKAINDFIAKLPKASAHTSAQLIIKELHSLCMNLDVIDNTDGISSLKQAIHALSGWKSARENYNPYWDYREKLPTLTTKFGASPFYKISVVNRNSYPYGNIIKISEGDLGLPDKGFYSFDHRHPIIRSYNTLLKDVLSIYVATATEQAKMFAENIFNYEKRIAKAILNTKSNGTASQIITFNDIKKAAPSLPVLETVTMLFSSTRITEDTMVLVEDMEELRLMSQIISTTDTDTLNDFIIWSLVRTYLPFMSREYRTALESFEQSIYHFEKPEPAWHYCSKLVQKWMPFGIEALQQNSELIVTHSSLNKVDDNAIHTDRLTSDYINYDEEFIKMMFYHLRNEFKSTITHATWINVKLTDFINDKLSSIRLQIGIPADLIKTNKYLTEYYNKFLLQKAVFVNNGQYHWQFEKFKMEELLSNMTDNEKIISELFPGGRLAKQPVMYSIDMNMVIVSKRILKKPYYNHKYPISINFARIGADLANVLLKAVFLIGEQYKEVVLYSQNSTNVPLFNNDIEGEAYKCVETKIKDHSALPTRVKMNFFSKITASRIALRALKSFLNKVDNNERIIDSGDLSDRITYETFNLRSSNRQAGLRKYDDEQLYSLAYMQKHCSIDELSYGKIKPFVEDAIPEKEAFRVIWEQNTDILKALDCSIKHKICDNIL